MKISVFWTWYVWLVSWACLSEIGHEVLCIDIDEKKIENLKLWIIPIYELWLEEIVKKNIKNKRLQFSTNAQYGIEFWEVIFNAVWTPPDKENQSKADLKFVKEVAHTFWKFVNSEKIFINKSTVPVGTGKLCKSIIEEEIKKRNVNIHFHIVSNPEFLREGTAVKDFMLPERIVCWIESDFSKEQMEEVYKPITRNYSQILFTSIESSELIKYASNTFLAIKISFINEIANFAELVWADIKEVSKWVGLDSRIWKRFLHAGIWYGWSCFPKDVQALIESGKENNFNFSLPKAAQDINSRQKNIIIDKIKKICSLKWKKVTLWGTSFKPKTDDVRESPSLDITISLLKEEVSGIRIFDPLSIENFKQYFTEGENISYFDDMYESITGSDILVLVTEWDEFRISDLEKIKNLMNNKSIIADGRNIWDWKELRKKWFIYIWIGL